MTVQSIILFFAAVVLLVWFFSWLGKKSARIVATVKKDYYAKLEKVPFFIFNFANITVRVKDVAVHLNNFKPLRVIFNDLKAGDFSETQFLMIRDDGAAAYNTKSAAEAVFKSAIHLALIEVTADKAGRLTVTPHALPGYEEAVRVELGYNAFKELEAPNFIKLAREYKG